MAWPGQGCGDWPCCRISGLECGPGAWVGWGEPRAELDKDSQGSWWLLDAKSTVL